MPGLKGKKIDSQGQSHVTCPICGCVMGMWLTTREVAEALNCSLHHVRDLIGAGHLTAMKFGADWRVKHDSLDALIRMGGSVTRLKSRN